MVDQRSSTSESGSNDFDLSAVTEEQDLGRLFPVMQRREPNVMSQASAICRSSAVNFVFSTLRVASPGPPEITLPEIEPRRFPPNHFSPKSTHAQSASCAPVAGQARVRLCTTFLVCSNRPQTSSLWNAEIHSCFFDSAPKC